MSLIKLIHFDSPGDDRGLLISLESQKTIPFDIKRVYYLFNTREGVRRGFHAHKKLAQVLICTSGSCTVLLDDGKKTEIIQLNSPAKGLFIDSLLWREMYDFSPDCVLMVLANDYYDETDYIRNYDKFLEEV